MGQPGHDTVDLAACTLGVQRRLSAQREAAADGGCASPAAAAPQAPAPAPPAAKPPTQASVVNTPKEVYESLVHSAEYRYESNLPKLFILGVQAGLYVGLGVSTCAIAGGSLSVQLRADQPGLFNLMYAAFGFPLALTIIVFTGTDLFTSSCMYGLLGPLEGKFGLYGLVRTLVVPYFSNLVGSLLLVGLQYGSQAFHGKLAEGFLIALAEKKCHLGWGVVVVRGIMANYLVCLAVWLASSARDFTGKFLGIWLPISSFVALGYEHCIANMFIVPMAMALGANITAAEFICKNLIPATIGNIIGGMSLVGLVYACVYGRPATVINRCWDGMVAKAVCALRNGRPSKDARLRVHA